MGYHKALGHPNVQHLFLIGLSSSTSLCALFIATPPATAQISGDGSLGTLVNGSLTDSCTTPVCTIAGGTPNETGSTLLHSFQEFTSPQNAPGSSALFVAPGVSDIVIRVTGGNPSFLNNAIRTSDGSTANLFFVNPSGITFGNNAQLDIGGSFLASTASSILFEDGLTLSTSSTTTPPASQLLTVSAPIGLGFLPDSTSDSIQVQGTGNRLTFGSPEAPNSQFVNRIFQQPLPPSAPFPPLPPISELSVRPGQTLSLVANGIRLEGGNLAASGGQIQIGSVASGTALLNADSSIDYGQVEQFADISLTNRSALEASASNAGSIQLNGKDISILDSSALLAETLPAQPAQSTAPGTIDIAATGSIEISGFTAEPAIPFNPPFFSYLSVDAAPGSTGNGGLLTLQAENIEVDSGGQLSATTFGSGNGGQISLDAQDVLALTGGSSFGPSGLFAAADAIGSGNSGTIVVEAGQLQMSEGAQISTISFTPGIAGLIEVEAEQIDLVGTSEPIEISTPEGTRQVISPTTIRSEMTAASTGKGAPIRLSADRLSVSEGAEVVTVTSGSGEASDIEIDAGKIVVSGNALIGEQGPSTIFSFVTPNASGSGGALDINTEQLQILDSAQVGTLTTGLGQAGSVSVEADQSVLIAGQTPLGRSGLFANAFNSTGAGGNLSISTETLVVTDGGTLNVSNFPSGTDAQFPPGQGDAGNLQVNARQISLSEAGIISADTAAGDRGNITLQTQALTLRQNSLIAANASGTATGGNITINAPDGFIIAVPDENSDITANAVFGDGGRIDITAQNILGIEPRPNPTPQSDITTSSEFGLSGQTRLETLDPEIRAENTSLPQSTDVPLVAQGCNATGSTNSRFVQSGRGGLSNSPYGTLNNRESLADTSLPSSLSVPSNQQTNNQTTNAQTTNDQTTNDQIVASPDIIAEAQGWSTNSQGEVVLLAAESSEADRCVSWN